MEVVLVRLLFAHIAELTLLGAVLIVQALGARMLLRTLAAKSSSALRTLIYCGALASMGIVGLGFLMRFARIARYLPLAFSSWLREASMGWALLSVSLIIMLAVLKFIPRPTSAHSPARRKFLGAMRAVTVAVPFAAFGYGTFIARTRIQLREESIAIPGLHPDLDGLLLAQLSDIHLSPFLSVNELERAVAMANETRPHVALVTGDLISIAGDPLDACLDALSRLRAPAGVFGCLGNHEIYAGTEDYTTERGAQLGMRFLRGAADPLRFGNATLNLAGVDYQRMHSEYLVGAEKMIQPGALNILLSHNPDVFPVAARQGWQCTIAGHTHGGQINVEILRQDLNVARFFTPYTVGQYRIGASSIYVSRGIGTIGVPVRLGSTPEVALLKLCRT
jgi:predicted MPP superfamily phosphohydrolase